jgi:hypothetical protein
MIGDFLVKYQTYFQNVLPQQFFAQNVKTKTPTSGKTKMAKKLYKLGS